MPRMREIGPQVALNIRTQMAKEGVTGTKDELKAIHLERCQKAASATADTTALLQLTR